MTDLFSHCSGGQSSNQNVIRVALPLETLGENLSLPFPPSGGVQHPLASLACGHSTPFSTPIFTLPSPLCTPSPLDVYLTKIPVIWFKAHKGSPGWSPHLKILNYTCKAPFFKKGDIHRFQDLEHGYTLWGGAGHHLTHYSILQVAHNIKCNESFTWVV